MKDQAQKPEVEKEEGIPVQLIILGIIMLVALVTLVLKGMGIF